MDARERRKAIWRSLCCTKYDTVANLAKKFDVSIRTIYYDVQALSLSYPIEAVRGRHCGGIKIPEWYNPNANVYSPAQLALLIKVKANLTGDDRVIMTSIIDCFTE